MHADLIAPTVATISVLLIPLLAFTFRHHIPSGKAWNLLGLGILLGAWTSFVSLGLRNWLVEPLLGLEDASRKIGSGFVAPLVEETVKGVAAILLLAWYASRDSIDRPGIAYGLLFGASVGLGFAIVEGGFDTLKHWLTSSHDGLNRLMVRSVSAHLHLVATAAFTGGAVVLLWGERWWRWLGTVGIAAAYGLHLRNNLGVVSPESDGVVNLAFAIVLAVIVGTWSGRVGEQVIQRMGRGS